MEKVLCGKRPEQSMELHDYFEHDIPMQWQIDAKEELINNARKSHEKIMKEWATYIEKLILSQ